MPSKTTNFIAIYHYPCPDGELSAAIFKSVHKNTIFIPWLHESKDKNIEIIKETIKKTNFPEVYFLDYCPEFSIIESIVDTVQNVTVIDHHKSPCEKFIEQFEEFNSSTKLNSSNKIFDEYISVSEFLVLKGYVLISYLVICL